MSVARACPSDRGGSLLGNPVPRSARHEGFLNLVLGGEYIAPARVYPWIGGKTHEPICDPAFRDNHLRDGVVGGSLCHAGRGEPQAHAYEQASVAQAPLRRCLDDWSGAAHHGILRSIRTGLSWHWPELRLQDMAAALCGRSRSENVPVLKVRTDRPYGGGRGG